MFVVQIIGFVTLFAAFIVGSPTIKVDDGQPATVEEYPFLAQLTVDKPNGMTGRCSASIIAPQYVISAYHCIKKREFDEDWAVKNTLVITGTNDAYQPSRPTGKVHKVEKFFHKNVTGFVYFPNLKDVMIIKLTEPIEFDDIQQPIIINANESLNAGDTITFAGVGPQPNKTADIFRKGETTIKEVINAGHYAPLNMYSSQGDSGGPIFTNEDGKWIQNGMITGGDAFPRISYLCDWIKEVTNNEVDC